MKKSPYRQLAERIAGDIEGRYWYCCLCLPKENAKCFKVVFEPTYEEKIRHNSLFEAWLSEEGTSTQYDNNVRILALLFMDEFVKTDKP